MERGTLSEARMETGSFLGPFREATVGSWEMEEMTTVMMMSVCKSSP
jgi:hypothetical protein